MQLFGVAADPQCFSFGALAVNLCILFPAQIGVPPLHHPNDASLFFLVKPVPFSSLPNRRVQERLVKGLQLLPPSPLHPRSLQSSDVPKPKTQPQSLLPARGHPSAQGSSRNAVQKQVWRRTTEICSLQYWDFWKLFCLGYRGGKKTRGFLVSVPQLDCSHSIPCY